MESGGRTIDNRGERARDRRPVLAAMAMVFAGTLAGAAASAATSDTTGAISATAASTALAQQDLGRVEFPNDGSAEAQPAFLRGVLLLHSFEFEDSAEAFREAQQIDPDLAIAYWGEAMTYNHPLWYEQDREAALAALGRLDATAEGRLAKTPTERERDFLRAVHVLYGAEGSGTEELSKQERDDAYAAFMRGMRERYPDDLEVAAFTALAILGTAHEGRDFATYMEAAAIVEEVFDANPDHPGAAHYLIHSYDDPIHAPLGLRPARVYAEIAPSATHALHMPSHIFLALGMWDRVAASNVDSYEASVARAERKGLDAGAYSTHALYWLQYAQLQQGRFEAARESLATMERIHAESGEVGMLVTMWALQVSETRQWGMDMPAVDLDEAYPFSRTDGVAAQGMAAIHRGDVETAQAAVARLEEIVEANPDARPGQLAATRILQHEIEALIALHAGDEAAALEALGRATEIEAGKSFAFGPPDPFKPSHELLGEVLLQLGRSHEAVAAFETALERNRRRTAGLLGLARAAHAAGDRQLAERTYAELREIWDEADPGIPGLEEARRLADAVGSGGAGE